MIGGIGLWGQFGEEPNRSGECWRDPAGASNKLCLITKTCLNIFYRWLRSYLIFIPLLVIRKLCYTVNQHSSQQGITARHTVGNYPVLKHLALIWLTSSLTRYHITHTQLLHITIQAWVGIPVPVYFTTGTPWIPVSEEFFLRFPFPSQIAGKIFSNFRSAPK